MTRLCERLATWLFAITIRLYPSEFRRQFGEDTLSAFARRARHTAQVGGTWRMVRHAALDLLAALTGLFAERLGRNSLSNSPRAGDRIMSSLLQDLRHALRALRLAPGFTAAAVVTLGLGIGLNTAIFSVVQAVLLRPLPYGEPSRLVAPRVTFQSQSWWSAALADVLEWRELSKTMESVSFGIAASLAVQAEGLPEQVPGVRVSADWFDTLGVTMARGRGFAAGEDSPNSSRVAILTHGYWDRQLGANPEIVGASLRIDGEETTVVGVLPQAYRADFWRNPQVYVTRRFTVEDATERVRMYTPVGRLRDGVALSAAQADADRVSRILAQRHPEAMQGWSVELQGLHEAVTGGQRGLLGTLLGAVSLVLLVACANVANLTMARGTGQRRELAVRTAMGATRARLIRQLLTETTVLALIGGSVGLLLAWWGTQTLLSQAPRIPRIDQAGVDPMVLGFTLVVSLCAGVLFGLIPAFKGTRACAQSALRQDDVRAGSSIGALSSRNLLVAAELALVVALLVAAGLTLRSFEALQRVDLGFDPDNKLLVPITLPTSFEYDEIDGIAQFFDQVRRRLATTPGVEAVADITLPPLFGGQGMTGFHLIEGNEYEPGSEPTGGTEMVSPGYFELMRMEILEGRSFTDLDSADSVPVAVINDAMARLHWPDASPIGNRVRIGKPDGGPLVGRWLEIVGVVRGVRYGPEREVRPRVYMADPQMPAPMNFRTLILTASGGDPLALVSGVREAVAAIDPRQPIGPPRHFDDMVNRSLSSRRLQSLLIGMFGIVALTLGAVGVYGVAAYAVSQRTREMGIRLALGATRGDVLRLVLRQAMVPVALGVIAGMAAATALAGALSSLLPRVQGVDALTMTAVPAVLVLTALLASWLPARRATRVDPASSLRAG